MTQWPDLRGLTVQEQWQRVLATSLLARTVTTPVRRRKQWEQHAKRSSERMSA